jgi:hypothetical protein
VGKEGSGERLRRGLISMLLYDVRKALRNSCFGGLFHIMRRALAYLER